MLDSEVIERVEGQAVLAQANKLVWALLGCEIALENVLIELAMMDLLLNEHDAGAAGRRREILSVMLSNAVCADTLPQSGRERMEEEECAW